MPFAVFWGRAQAPYLTALYHGLCQGPWWADRDPGGQTGTLGTRELYWSRDVIQELFQLPLESWSSINQFKLILCIDHFSVIRHLNFFCFQQFHKHQMLDPPKPFPNFGRQSMAPIPLNHRSSQKLYTPGSSHLPPSLNPSASLLSNPKSADLIWSPPPRSSSRFFSLLGLCFKQPRPISNIANLTKSFHNYQVLARNFWVSKF